MEWKEAEVTSPHLDKPVAVIAARDVPYVTGGHRFQTLSVYLPRTASTSGLIGQPATSLPSVDTVSKLPRWHVHIHGGAWRDPQLTAASIEAAVAHAFSTVDAAYPITAVASINYTLSPFPTHPALPYDPIKDDHSDPSREAKHPQHVHDVLNGLNYLRTLGLTDESYILSGHSAGGCLMFQSILQPPAHWGLHEVPDAPKPAALLGMNGLYDLPSLVHGLGQSHIHLKDVYQDLIGIAFGADQSTWSAASPAGVDPNVVAERIETGRAPGLVVLDQSTEDQLVPLNQTETLEGLLSGVPGMTVVRGHKCTGKHAAPWEQGYMIWESVQDVIGLLDKKE